MTTNNIWRSDLPSLYNLVQNSMILYPKEIIIATLRDYYSKDSYYHFATDNFGFPQTPDHTDLPRDSGFHDNTTTRVFIGESYRYDVIYYPAIIVRSGGSNSVPISMNRETGSVQWEYMTFSDGCGNTLSYKYPASFIFAGAWEGSINIDISTRDLRSRDDLVDATSILFTDFAVNDLIKSGILIKNVSAGSPTEVPDRTDMLFKQTVTLQIRSEWRREIPISNVIDTIKFAVDIGRVNPESSPAAPNMRIDITETLSEILSNI